MKDEHDPHAWRKAIEIRERLRAEIGGALDSVHHIDIVLRFEGRDWRIQFDWVKELLK